MVVWMVIDIHWLVGLLAMDNSDWIIADVQ